MRRRYEEARHLSLRSGRRGFRVERRGQDARKQKRKRLDIGAQGRGSLNRLGFAGALHDPVAALVFCQPQEVDWNFVHGQAIVKEGQLLTVDVPRLVEWHNRAARRLLE